MPKVDPLFREYAAKRKDKKLMVSSIEGVITEIEEEYKTFMLDNMYDIFSISSCIATSVEKYYNRKTDVLPLGVNQILVQDRVHKEIKSIVWVGNIKANKRPMYLVEIAKRFPQLQFTMIGDGDLQDQVKAYIAENQLSNVVLTGRIPNDEVYAYMQKADLLLMTSEFEGLPKVIQEAAQCGLPSIYMANNYSVDFIENGGNGYEAYSLEEMVEKLQYLLDNPNVYQETSKKAAEVIQEYTWEKLIPKYESWFTNVLERYRNERGNK